MFIGNNDIAFNYGINTIDIYNRSEYALKISLYDPTYRMTLSTINNIKPYGKGTASFNVPNGLSHYLSITISKAQ